MDMTRIGKLCKAARKRNNTKQKDIAKNIDYSVSAIRKFEAGQNNNALMLLYYTFQFFTKEELDSMYREVMYDEIERYSSDHA